MLIGRRFRAPRHARGPPDSRTSVALFSRTRRGYRARRSGYAPATARDLPAPAGHPARGSGLAAHQSRLSAATAALLGPWKYRKNLQLPGSPGALAPGSAPGSARVFFARHRRGRGRGAECGAHRSGQRAPGGAERRARRRSPIRQGPLRHGHIRRDRRLHECAAAR